MPCENTWPCCLLLGCLNDAWHPDRTDVLLLLAHGTVAGCRGVKATDVCILNLELVERFPGDGQWPSEQQTVFQTDRAGLMFSRKAPESQGSVYTSLT